jgi:DUF1365 family protein
MRHKIYWGKVDHLRQGPRRHAFSYPLFTLALDVEALEALPVPRWLLGYNRFALLSIWDKDYLHTGSQSIRQKLQTFLQAEGVAEVADSVLVYSMPRFLGYVFNPVSFYLGRNCQGALLYTLAEVHNTFGEAHLYLLQAANTPVGSTLGRATRAPSFPVVYSFPKQFFVSPFYPVSGDYKLTVAACDQTLDISVELYEQGLQVFAARLWGQAKPLSTRSLLATLACYPFCILLTMLRIQVQALLLFFGRSVEVYLKPQPSSSGTIRSAPGFLDRARLAVVARMHARRERTNR